ncbi:MAG: hypothetical protein GC168_06890 [Candidatus Hydrogenedens sp.]|nr:hypothetical protein [Candidatus Hydrogenedens sp.]
MKVQCCCCKKTRTDQNRWVEEQPEPADRVSHTYCPKCYEREIRDLRSAMLLNTPMAVAH